MSENLPPGRFFGTTTGSWRVGPFVLSESVYAPHARLRPHAHARAYLALVVRGGHRETTGAQERSCGPATVVFHPVSERHANQFSPLGGRVFRVEMDDDWLNRLRDCSAGLDRSAESHRGPLSQIASRMFSEFRARDGVSSLMIEALALEFVTRVVRARELPCGRAPVWIADVADYLHAHAADDICLDDLARLASVHPAHLNRAFRRWHGCSIGEHIRRLRVDLAARELAMSQKPIADIASSLRFADQSHFSRVFSRLTGMTPGRYRKLHSR